MSLSLVWKLSSVAYTTEFSIEEVLGHRDRRPFASSTQPPARTKARAVRVAKTAELAEREGHPQDGIASLLPRIAEAQLYQHKIGQVTAVSFELR